MVERGVNLDGVEEPGQILQAVETARARRGEDGAVPMRMRPTGSAGQDFGGSEHGAPFAFCSGTHSVRNTTSESQAKLAAGFSSAPGSRGPHSPRAARHREARGERATAKAKPRE